MWGNDQYGDCVTAEEGFAKACYSPEIFIDPAILISWAGKHGWLNGANLPPVMDAMAQSGFKVGSQLYNDGPYTTVDYSNEMALQSAIALGPVKLGMAAGALPSGAGNNQGWYAIKAVPDNNEDHCTALSGYGPAAWLYQQLGVPLPSGVTWPTMCYLFYTWSTIGVVSHDWIMGCVGEAWVRNPTTVGVPPLTPPPVADEAGSPPLHPPRNRRKPAGAAHFGMKPFASKRGCRAFTLVELLFALLLFGVGFAALCLAIAFSVFLTRTSKESLRASQIMVEKMEHMRLYTWEQITNTTSIPRTFTEYLDPSATNRGTVFNGRVVITPVSFNSACATNMRLVTVLVDWNSKIPQTRQMQTFVSKNGLQQYVY